MAHSETPFTPGGPTAPQVPGPGAGRGGAVVVIQEATAAGGHLGERELRPVGAS